MEHLSFSVIGVRLCRFYKITRELKRSSSQMLPPLGSEPRHWLSSDFHVLHATISANSPISPCRKFNKFCHLREINKFFPNVSQWEGYFSCSFSVEYPQISKSSEINPLFGQRSSDVQLVAFNYRKILKDNIGKNHRNLWIFRTMCVLEISKFWLMTTNQFNPVSTGLYSQ